MLMAESRNSIDGLEGSVGADLAVARPFPFAWPLTFAWPPPFAKLFPIHSLMKSLGTAISNPSCRRSKRVELLNQT
jgi:hypothetical protein